MENGLNIDNAGQSAVKPTFVLVHAAWQGPYAWESVKKQLAEKGFQVEVVQLPGHGDDYTDPKLLKMASYIGYVTNVIKKIGHQVILVGHSLAGIIISGVAEEIPNLIEKLVFVAAYVPESGQSAYAISLLDKQSILGASLSVSDDQSVFNIKEEDIFNIFCQDGSEDAKKALLQHYRPEPAAPFGETVSLSDERFGKIPKYYIETLKDHGIGNDLQKQMIATAGIKHVYSLNSGHTPSLSVPDKTSDLLREIALR
jgi:pimeloyl-ACP methyl ester carboxylesterase